MSIKAEVQAIRDRADAAQAPPAAEPMATIVAPLRVLELMSAAPTDVPALLDAHDGLKSELATATGARDAHADALQAIVDLQGGAPDDYRQLAADALGQTL